MTVSILSTLLSYIMGPVGALIICVILLYGIYKFVNDQVWPMTIKWVDRHQNQMETIIKDNQVSLQGIAESINKNTLAIVVLSERVNYLTDEIDNIKTPSKIKE